MAAAFLLISVQGQQFGLPLTAVQRVLRAVEITHVPDAPDEVRGVINVHGHLTIVIETSSWFGVPARELELSDHLILLDHGEQLFALVADQVRGLFEEAESDFADAAPGLLSVESGEDVSTSPFDQIKKVNGEIVFVSSLGALAHALERIRGKVVMPRHAATAEGAVS